MQAYQPLSLFPKEVVEKSKIEEKYPLSPTKSGSSPSLRLKTSPTEKASWGPKVRVCISPKNSPIPWASASIREMSERPSSLSEG